jgi:hypothetical protein
MDPTSRLVEEHKSIRTEKLAEDAFFVRAEEGILYVFIKNSVFLCGKH